MNDTMSGMVYKNKGCQESDEKMKLAKQQTTAHCWRRCAATSAIYGVVITQSFE